MFTWIMAIAEVHTEIASGSNVIVGTYAIVELYTPLL